MPEMMVCPESGSVSTRKVGSSRRKRCKRLAEPARRVAALGHHRQAHHRLRHVHARHRVPASAKSKCERRLSVLYWASPPGSSLAPAGSCSSLCTCKQCSPHASRVPSVFSLTKLMALLHYGMHGAHLQVGKADWLSLHTPCASNECQANAKRRRQLASFIFMRTLLPKHI